MLNKFWEGLSEKLADRWIAVLLGPAFVFWFGGLLIWITRFGWASLQQFAQLTQDMQLTVLIGALLIMVVSSAALEPLILPTLRLLEGYWPRWLGPLRGLFMSWQNHKIERAEQRWQDLATKGIVALTAAERDEYVLLDRELRLAPNDPGQRMPTRLGNILRAMERRPEEKYGLDAVVCWPRLWLLLPDGVKAELTSTRATLDAGARIWLWSMLFLAWSVWAWWLSVPLGLLAAFFAYRWTLSGAEVYGELVEAAFDLHRVKLYEALRWPLPETTSERMLGRQITEYLFRGPPESALPLQAPKQSDGR